LDLLNHAAEKLFLLTVRRATYNLLGNYKQWMDHVRLVPAYPVSFHNVQDVGNLMGVFVNHRMCVQGRACAVSVVYGTMALHRLALRNVLWTVVKHI
jgi:hypothetical protein